MKILSIALDDQEMPAEITATLTLAEAVALTKFAGGLSPKTATEQGYVYAATSGVYDALTGSVFNRFWDDGHRDAARYARQETPDD